MIRLLAYITVLSTATVQGQNLVPNPSFEEYTECPSNISQIDRAVGWTTLSGSSDYFNVCCPNDSMSVPLNNFGYQLAADGQAYAGVATYVEGIPYYRENLWAQLETQLSVGVMYHLSMKVSPGGYGNSIDNSAHWATRGIGMRLFTTQLSPGVHQDNTALLYMDEVLQDTSQWTVLSRDFVADSAYGFILIGDFFSDSLLQITPLDPNGTFGAYAFIDQVCVSAQTGVCDQAQLIGEPAPLVSVAGTCFNAELRLRWMGQASAGADLSLIDVAGRRWKEATANGQDVIWNTAELADGQYILLIRTSMGIERPIRLVHVSP